MIQPLQEAKSWALQWISTHPNGLKVLTSLREAKRAVRLAQYTEQQKKKFSSYGFVEKLISDFEVKNPPTGAPVIIMNASSRTSSMALNNAAGIFASWVLRVAGRRVIHLSCQSGLPQCLQGANWADTNLHPPCFECTGLSRALFPKEHTQLLPQWPKHYDADLLQWSESLKALTIADLQELEFEGLELGKLVLPSVLWAMRLGDLKRDENSKSLYIQSLIGSAQAARQFRKMIQKERPVALLAFNGIVAPEAIAAIIAEQEGIRLVTFETGYKEGSIFFCHGRKATHCETLVPDHFLFGEQEAQELDLYLERRFKGRFTMGGVRFWPEMKGVDDALRTKITAFRQMVTVFTNVVFDTSQAHGNICFTNMFEWLKATMELARVNPQTLFIVRTHPDEARPGKSSRQQVTDWIRENGYEELFNIHVLGPTEKVSSYELIRLSKFVIAYNSLVGLEALLLGKLTVTGACTRYHSSGTANFYETPKAYLAGVQSLLEADDIPENPERVFLARRFYYFTMFKGFLDLSPYIGLQDECLSKIQIIEQLMSENSMEARILLGGILDGKPFHYPI